MERTDPDVENQQRNRELSILNAIAQALNREVDLAQALQATLVEAAELLGLHTGWIWLLDEDTGDSYLAAALNLPPALARHPRRMGGTCYCLDTFRSGDLEGAANVNVITCSRLQWLSGGTRGLKYHASIPLYAQEKKLGVLNVASPDWRELSTEDLRILYTIGDMLSIAIERARLFARSAQMGAIEERNRLAREIHDTLAQGLAGISLQLEAAEALLETGADPSRVRSAIGQALSLAQGNLEEARRSVLDLRAAPLEGRTLAEAIGKLVQEYAASTKTRLTFEVVGGNRRLPVRIEAGLYRVAQETLANLLQHAGAKNASLRLEYTPEQVRLVTTDDGRGFDPADIPAGRFGLVGLRERVKLLQGELRIQSDPARGTRLEVSIPMVPRSIGAGQEVRVPDNRAIRIVVADDHPVVRDGLVAVLGTQPDFQVAGEAGDGVAAARLAIDLRPDVLLLDLEMPGLDGTGVLARLAEAQAPVKTLVFTAYDTDERILTAIRLGAQGYLLKGAPREVVFNAIRIVAAGGSLLEPVVAMKLIQQATAGARVGEPRDLAEPLTAREAEVLACLAEGKTNKEIARELVVSERTVKFHVSSILAKLSAGNRTEAVKKAVQLKLVRL